MNPADTLAGRGTTGISAGRLGFYGESRVLKSGNRAERAETAAPETENEPDGGIEEPNEGGGRPDRLRSPVGQVTSKLCRAEKPSGSVAVAGRHAVVKAHKSI